MNCVGDGVSIGTALQAAGFRLSASGKIIASGARIDAKSRWPDYVFKSGYSLKSLPALERYINRKGHLPNVPRSAEVLGNGIDLGDSSAKLLEKVEELTLYMIELNDRLNKIESNIKN